MDYQSIKDLAVERGLSVTELLALAPANDPFYVGTSFMVDFSHTTSR